MATRDGQVEKLSSLEYSSMNNSTELWCRTVDEVGGQKSCRINDLTFKPDGSELLVASGLNIFVYDVHDGNLIQTLHGHRDTVHCVVYSPSGEKFASGSADKSVIVWTDKHEGMLKFNHSDSIQCLTFCPINCILLSCAISDFGLWTLEKKTVDKHKSSARICSCSWASNGEYFALGLYNGIVSFCNKMGDEMLKVNRPNGCPVWNLAFNPFRPEEFLNESENETMDIALAVLDWSSAIAFYDINGQKMLEDVKLDYDPLCLDYLAPGEFMAISGSNRKVNLHTRTGTYLFTVAEMKSWVWVCRAKPDSHHIALGCEDGTVAIYQLRLGTVHGLYDDRYAYRDNITDVVVQHLTDGSKVRVNCQDLVKKVAVYKDKIAVQLSNRICIYECRMKSSSGMEYLKTQAIAKDFECSLLVLCSKYVVLCMDGILQSCTLSGYVERQWVLDSMIRYIKVVDGTADHESLLVGLKNGQVLKIFLDNPFPVELMKHNDGIRCLDLSIYQTKLAMVGENGICFVYDLITEELLFQESQITSVACNRQHEDIICMSGANTILVRIKDFPAYELQMPGLVVGFSGSQVFCLYLYAMTTIEVPLSFQIQQCIDRKLFSLAYSVASLGAHSSEWEHLGLCALQSLEYDLAKKAFQRTKNFKYLNLIDRLQRISDDDVAMAMMFACTGKIEEAANLFQKCGYTQMAVEMYLDLHMFEKTNELIGSIGAEGKQNLISKQALLAYHAKDFDKACEMYLAANDFEKAITIMDEQKWIEKLAALGKQLDETNYNLLNKIAKTFEKYKEYPLASEVYGKIRDVESLIRVKIFDNHWKEAFQIVKQHPEFEQNLYVEYANWLIKNQKFEEAQIAYCRAGLQEQALDVLVNLADVAIDENRFKDASYFYWLLSMQYLSSVNANQTNEDLTLKQFYKYQQFADLYYIYDFIYKYTEEPFTFLSADTLFNVARCLLNSLQLCHPKKISKIKILYTLAKQAKQLGAFRLGRIVCDQLGHLNQPPSMQTEVDLLTLSLKAKPFQDPEDLLPVCYVCSMGNPILSRDGGNKCVHCGLNFIYSFLTFESLPLIEFEIEGGITRKEFQSLLQCNASSQEEIALLQSKKVKNGKVVYRRADISALKSNEVFVCRRTDPLKDIYYRNLMPEISISQCHSCNKFFHTDDWEFFILRYGHCPFCRKKLNLNDDWDD
ncbi:Intraflagellar transport protein -like protein [Trichinella nelsoni]|uniref:Intraflagellar transport protein 122 homolog n=1 Tax=Trichinella nelsoni TaxID=6336 RepID=A0A0V0RXY5_9BILA|nr:Intraflagellar transport protein -like protein [Trichinella nelsoni]